MKTKHLLKQIMLSLLFLAAALPLAAQTYLIIGSDSNMDLSTNQSSADWAWNATSKTLTLTGDITTNGIIIYGDALDATISTDAAVTVTGQIQVGTGKLTLNGSGTLNVNYSVSGQPALLSYGMEIAGTITVNISTTGAYSSAVMSAGDFTMSAGKLYISTNRSNSNGIHVNGNIAISSTATVVANVTGNGIFAGNEITISDNATVEATSSGDIAIYTGNVINISGGTVAASAPFWAIGSNSFNTNMYVTGGTLTTGNTGSNGNIAGSLTVSGSTADVTINGNINNNLTVSDGTVIHTGIVGGTTTHTGGTINGSAPVALSTGTIDIGGTTGNNLATNASGIGWTWTASTSTLTLTDTYTSESIAINCQSTDQIKLVYTGDVTVSSGTQDVIFCNGKITMDGSGGTLSLAYTGSSYMYSSLTSMQLLTISSGNISIECAATSQMNGGSIMGHACAVYARMGFSIAANANVTISNTGANSHGFYTEQANSEISTTGTITANATGAGYALSIMDSYFITISNGTVNLSNADNPENMIYGNHENGYFIMTGGTVTYNNGTAPVLTGISPNSGTFGIEAILTGQNLSQVRSVRLNRRLSPAFASDNDSQITFTTPAGEAGSGNILIETDGGATFLTNSFTYTSTSYRVTLISGGNIINIIGFICGFLDTETGTITKPTDPVPIKNGGDMFVFTGGWYKDIDCTTEWDFDMDVVTKDMNLYAKFIEVSTDARLANLTVSEGTLTPVFSADETSYTVSVVNSVSQITIDAIANDGNASVSGDTGTKNLNKGENPFNIVVTAEDGTTKKTYTITVSRGSAIGIEEINAANIRIYQSNDILYLESPEYIKDIQLYNINGILVFRQANTKNMIDISTLSKGVYILTVVTSKGETIRKIVKE